jgi:hypothetical protein
MLLSSLRSLGLASSLLLVAGCGGKVVFDGVPGESPGGQGGHGGAANYEQRANLVALENTFLWLSLGGR